MANLTLDPFVQGELVKILQIYEVGTAQCTPTVGVEDVFEPCRILKNQRLRGHVSVCSHRQHKVNVSGVNGYTNTVSA